MQPNHNYNFCDFRTYNAYLRSSDPSTPVAPATNTLIKRKLKNDTLSLIPKSPFNTQLKCQIS